MTAIRKHTPMRDGDERERKAHAERAAEHMRKLHADPQFAKAHAAAVSAAQKKRWAKWREEHKASGLITTIKLR